MTFGKTSVSIEHLPSSTSDTSEYLKSSKSDNFTRKFHILTTETLQKFFNLLKRTTKISGDLKKSSTTGKISDSVRELFVSPMSLVKINLLIHLVAGVLTWRKKYFQCYLVVEESTEFWCLLISTWCCCLMDSSCCWWRSSLIRSGYIDASCGKGQLRYQLKA